jgi:hypothetical protein
MLIPNVLLINYIFDKENNHTPGEEWVLLLVLNKLEGDFCSQWDNFLHYYAKY